MKKIISNWLLAGCSLVVMGIHPISAQVSVSNSLMTGDLTGIKLGEGAKLTAASGADPMGAGWLRLTNAATNQKGYMYTTTAFPTDNGVMAEFEYKTWRNTADNTYQGADGFTFFLFDGAITDSNFTMGGWGGSLGYATFVTGPTPGLSGGYIGVGFDEFGNFARNNESRNGGVIDPVPNSVVLRGPTTATFSTSNVYFTHAALGDRSGDAAAIRLRNEIDYNTVTTTRPADNIFYRRVQVYITKVGANYLVNVKWRKEGQTAFTNILSYTIDGATYPMPSTLKMGFSGGTGGGFNFHEIRNIILTTPGNLRVGSSTNSGMVCNEKGDSPVTFTVNVMNDTAVALTDINLTDKITDASGNVLDLSKFKITSITTSGFTSSTLPITSPSSNNISGTLGLAANTFGTVTITGNYLRKSIATNQSFQNMASVTTANDTDLTNNQAVTKIDVRRCSIMVNPALPVKFK